MPDNDTSGFLSHYMKPIEEVFGLGVEIQLQLAHRIATIGEKGHMLIHLHALGFEHLEHTPFRLGIVAVNKGKAFRCALGRDTLARDHLKPPVFP